MSLASLAVLGGFAYRESRALLRASQLDKLQAVAASKQQELERVLESWRNRVELVTSRTQLGILMDRVDREADGRYREGLTRVLEHVLRAAPDLVGVQLYSETGEVVAHSGVLPEAAAPTPEELDRTRDEAVQRPAFIGPEQRLLVSYLAPMSRVDRRIGSAWVVLSTEEISAVTADTKGLGRTGEVLLARLEADGSPQLLSRLRNDPDAAPGRPLREEPGRRQPELVAATGIEGLWTDGVDYRGEPVYAATGWLSEPGWGLVVKVDVAEEREEVAALRDTLTKLALSLSAFGIVAGLVQALIFAKPIRRLAEVARRVEEGEWDVRADESAEDEIGQLGMSFNRMTDELVAANRELEQRLNGNANRSERRSC